MLSEYTKENVRTILPPPDLDNPDYLGEALRTRFFIDGAGLGCYDTFAVKSDVEYIGAFPDPYDHILEWQKYRLQTAHALGTVYMEYVWDGDGNLRFTFDDGTVLTNSDCKCTYGWDFAE
jgi:hypothetical protein